MSLIQLDDLTTPVSEDDVKTSIYDVLSVVGVTTTGWKPGAVVRTIITAVAIVFAAVSTLIAYIARSGFLELASGLWLTLVARYAYGVERIAATFATGEVTLDNAGGGVYPYEIGELVFLNPTTKKTYTNTESGTLGALETGHVVSIQAIEVGSGSTSLPGTIVALVTTLTNVTCSNEDAVIGVDEESDPALRLRCTETLGALSPMGPPDAYASAARNAVRADGTAIGINRVRSFADGSGNVTVVVATATGGVTGDPDDETTDLGAINLAVQQDAAPLAVTADTISATALPIDVTYELWIVNTSELTNAEIQSTSDSRLTSFMSVQPIGGNVIDVSGYVFQDAIRAAVGELIGNAVIVRALITAPASDQLVGAFEAPVIGDVTCVGIHQIASGQQ